MGEYMTYEEAKAFLKQVSASGAIESKDLEKIKVAMKIVAGGIFG